MWYVPVITDRTILVNRPGVVQHDKTQMTCLLIDAATPDDSDGNTKETGKISKYEDQETEFSRMWEVRTKIVPVIIGVLGTNKQELDQNLQLLPAHLSATELQKITLMSTAHSIR